MFLKKMEIHKSDSEEEMDQGSDQDVNVRNVGSNGRLWSKKALGYFKDVFCNKPSQKFSECSWYHFKYKKQVPGQLGNQKSLGKDILEKTMKRQ